MWPTSTKKSSTVCWQILANVGKIAANSGNAGHIVAISSKYKEWNILENCLEYWLTFCKILANVANECKWVQMSSNRCELLSVSVMSDSC